MLTLTPLSSQLLTYPVPPITDEQLLVEYCPVRTQACEPESKVLKTIKTEIVTLVIKEIVMTIPIARCEAQRSGLSENTDY